MSDEINDGGPAFPIPEKLYEHSEISPFGMSLRDWFAGQALAGLLANNAAECAKFVKQTESGLVITDHYAARSYAYADAMLAAREAK